MVLVVGYSKLKFMIPFNIFMFCGLVGFIFSYYYVESVSYIYVLINVTMIDLKSIIKLFTPIMLFWCILFSEYRFW